MPALAPWFVVAAGNCALAVGWIALALVAWTVLASVAFLWMSGLLGDPHIAAWARPFQWWVYVRLLGRSWVEGLYLGLSAAAAAMPFALAVRLAIARRGEGSGFPFGAGRGRGKIVRGGSDNHGHAAWPSVPAMRALFPSAPDDDVGGVVVGEADRVDLGPVARVAFDPEDRSTWGNGGKAPLLIDPCKRGSTHSIVIGGGGTYKSTTLVTTLLTWRKSVFVLDPAEELADLVGAELEYRGRKVVRLGIGAIGPNVLDGIDPADEMAETRVRAVVGRLTGPIDEGEKGSNFKKWGRSIILALLLHLVWEPSIPADLKTLRTLRLGLDGGDEALRNRLRGIAELSHSPAARSIASGLWGVVKETLDGAIMHANEMTEWLASPEYADLVSGDAYRMGELVEGNLAVFCQVPLESLLYTPAVARVLVGCHIDAVFAAKGQVNGRVLFPIDEAVLIGNDPSLQIACDQGRKSKITLQLFYQSEGQIEKVWTASGKKAWYDGLSWRTYAGIQNLDTARELNAVLGKYAVRAVSSGTNKGTSGKPMEMVRSGSRGSNTSEHEIARDLASADELLGDLRDDERITLPRNRRPIRHGAAIGFRRPEIECLLGTTRYRNPAPPPRPVPQAVP